MLGHDEKRRKSGLAQAALRRAAEKMRRDEEERRNRYVAGITVLYNCERDIALATYNGEGAATAIISLAEAIHGANSELVARALNSEAETLTNMAATAAAMSISSQ